jgi:hypothetical protein
MIKAIKMIIENKFPVSGFRFPEAHPLPSPAVCNLVLGACCLLLLEGNQGDH